MKSNSLLKIVIIIAAILLIPTALSLVFRIVTGIIFVIFSVISSFLGLILLAGIVYLAYRAVKK